MSAPCHAADCEAHDCHPDASIPQHRASSKDGRGIEAPIFTAIDHVQLAMPAGRENDARAFFCDVLGMVELPKPAELAKRGGCWFSSGTVQIHLGVDQDFRPARKAHPGLRCADLSSVLARLRAAGIEYEEDTAMNAPRAFMHDPFGNRIELVG